MTQMVFPVAVFILLLGTGLLVALVGIRILLRTRKSSGRPSRGRLALGAVAVAVGLLVSAGTVHWGVSWLAFQQDLDSRFVFRYSATLEFNGSGVVRVSLPIPVEERLLEGIQVTGSSSTLTLNRSSAEPALDVTFSDPTSVSVEFRGRTPPDQFQPANLTRNDQRGSTFSLEVLAGDVTSVHVELQASWRRTCHLRSWDQDVWIARGNSDYPGQWSDVAC